MSRRIKRLLLLAVVALLGAAVLRARRHRPVGASSPTAPASSWPPFEPIVEPLVSESVSDWLEPVDGVCPDGYLIKANNNSHIFHLPGGRFYERTIAQRCYATAEAAERDGYRRAKA